MIVITAKMIFIAIIAVTALLDTIFTIAAMVLITAAVIMAITATIV